MRIVLAMSGGVDSSVSAHLLQSQGHQVIGLFMRSGAKAQASCATTNSEDFPHKQGCCSAADAADARRVADELDIPFHALDFEEGFQTIKDYFADQYLAGRTPNPCIVCNNWLKFGRLWDFAQQVGAERIATGHYAQLTPADGESCPALVRGLDPGKDQSYVLFGIHRDLLSRIVFPVGGYTKAQIREMAHRAGFGVADKRDSQEICFIPDDDYVAFLEQYRGKQDTSGEMVDTSGRVVGQHEGYERFTIGQRKGLGISFGSPRFVIAIEPETKRVVIGTRDELARSSLEADHLNWLIDDVPSLFTCRAQIRYQHKAALAQAEFVAPDRLHIQFHEPQFGIAPGQAVVLYDNDRVLGGGWIR